MATVTDFPSLDEVKVMFVDDYQAVVEMMAEAVTSIAGLRVVGVAFDAESALEICQREQPDMVTLSMVMPDASGLTLMSELQKIIPRLRVLIFSGHLHPATIQEGLGAGVLGFVEKSVSLQEFRSAIVAVSQGRSYFDAKTSQIVRDLVHQRVEGAMENAVLTSREKSVLQLLAQGKSSKEIAHLLEISVHTVINHRSNLMRKTGLRKVAQLALYAVEIGLLSGLDDLISAAD